jgi:hypothetical protein
VVELMDLRSLTKFERSWHKLYVSEYNETLPAGRQLKRLRDPEYIKVIIDLMERQGLVERFRKRMGGGYMVEER